MELSVSGNALMICATALLSVVHRADSCSQPEGWRPPTIVEKILQVPVVLYGRIERTYSDPRFGYGSETSSVYTAQMFVYCSLKGQQVKQQINITEAGHIPGHCTSTTLIMGKTYIVPLNHQFRPQGMYMSEIQVSKMAEVMKACGLNPVYPEGVDPAAQEIKCPTPSPPGECLDQSNFTREPPLGAVRKDDRANSSDDQAYSSNRATACGLLANILNSAGAVILIIVTVTLTL